MTNREITDAIEEFAPLSLQESWDNSGWQIGHRDEICRGALLCVDITPEIIHEAIEKGCNLIISHHPLIFKGVKQITDRDRVERCIALAIENRISVYSSHTATDCAPGGVSWEMGRRLALTNMEFLDESGLGVIGDLNTPLHWREFVKLVKERFGAEIVRCSHIPNEDWRISRIGLCGGAAAEFIPLALKRGAQAYVTADCKLNQFIDHAEDILLVDSGHFETEECTKEIFYRVISEKFPNFAVCKSIVERNPVVYL